MGNPLDGNTHKGTGVTVTFSGVPAMELRRVAANLHITPAMLIRDLVEKGMKDNYGITIK